MYILINLVKNTISFYSLNDWETNDVRVFQFSDEIKNKFMDGITKDLIKPSSLHFTNVEGCVEYYTESAEVVYQIFMSVIKMMEDNT